jgi:hypothetical protein
MPPVDPEFAEEESAAAELWTAYARCAVTLSRFPAPTRYPATKAAEESTHAIRRKGKKRIFILESLA